MTEHKNQIVVNSTARVNYYPVVVVPELTRLTDRIVESSVVIEIRGGLIVFFTDEPHSHASRRSITWYTVDGVITTATITTISRQKGRVRFRNRQIGTYRMSIKPSFIYFLVDFGYFYVLNITSSA